MAHTLPELPYAKDALAPHISAETLEYHHGKHHAGYVAKLNAAVEGTAVADWSAADLVTRINEVPSEIRGGVFNCAAQHINHSFYWTCLRPGGGGLPDGALLTAIEGAFGSFDAFKAAFTKASATHFGSGWGWLVKDATGALEVMGTHDADTPIAHGKTPILTCDVWEHAYYIDYRNNRGAYIDGFWQLVNWDFCAAQFG